MKLTGAFNYLLDMGTLVNIKRSMGKRKTHFNRYTKRERSIDPSMLYLSVGELN